MMDKVKKKRKQGKFTYVYKQRKLSYLATQVLVQ